MTVKLYTTATCAFCEAEKDFLDDKGVKYQVIAVDQDQAAAQEMVALSGQLAVPFTVVEDNGVIRAKVLGFDRPALIAALGIG